MRYAMGKEKRVFVKNAFGKMLSEEGKFKQTRYSKNRIFLGVVVVVATDGISYFTKAPSKFLLQLTKFTSLKEGKILTS